jgi:peptidoglycan/xylan/chitin deacetylase (PgdA/CDA1 family)
MVEKLKPEGKEEIVTKSFTKEETEDIERLEELSAIEKKTKALDIVAKINELKTAAQTKQDYQELTKFYQQLEKIYEGKEGQELEPWLAQQYEKQIDILRDACGFELESGEVGITGIDGKDYPAPTQEEIAVLVAENRELIEKKKEQGFTKLLIVPFGMKLEYLIGAYQDVITRHKETNKLFAAKKDASDPNEKLVPLELDESKPVWVWDQYDDADVNGKLVYHPEKFDKKDHQGKTKGELLQQGGGWSILLIEDMPNIPETDPKTVGGRTQIDTKGSAMEQFLSGKKVPTPKEYLQFIEQETIYSGEQGMTPEDQLMYAITHLEETDQIIDDYQGNGKISYQVGAYFPSSDNVPYACWNRDNRQAGMSGNYPGNRNGHCGVRSTVRIKKS